MKKRRKSADPEMRAHHDFTGGVRGKYVDRYRAGSHVILLDPDVAAVFTDAETVNTTLRALIELAHKHVKIPAKRFSK